MNDLDQTQGVRGNRLAFVLGSGGVRSVAAIGIAEGLAREGIYPDFIAGCSSGAMFGAQLALRMRGEDALRMATRLWSQELTEKRRWLSYLQLVAPRLAGFDTRFAMRDDALITERLEEAFGDVRLEHLPTPLRVVATDAATGRRVVLQEGRLTDALRASMAVPILFPGVPIQGRTLVDGVLSDPLPVTAAADAGVIVTLGFEGDMPRHVDRLSRLVAQTSTTLINNLMQARLDAARAAGLKVIPIELSLSRRVGLWETSALPEIFEAGLAAARRHLRQIATALSSPATPSPPQPAHA